MCMGVVSQMYTRELLSSSLTRYIHEPIKLTDVSVCIVCSSRQLWSGIEVHLLHPIVLVGVLHQEFKMFLSKRECW